MWGKYFLANQFTKAKWFAINDILGGFSGGSDSKESAFNARDPVWSLDQEDPLEKVMATHCSILAWRILWAEEFGWLQSMELPRVRYDWVTNTYYVQDILLGIGDKLAKKIHNVSVLMKLIFF